MTLDSTANKAKEFAANIVKAAGRYADTDGDLGKRLGQQQFGPSGGQAQPGSAAESSAGSPMGGMSQMGEMMQMPMQMAAQALQAPMQMAGMLGSFPQTLMQGMQSLGGMAGMGGHGGGQQDKGDANAADLLADQQDKDKQDRPAEPQHEAAGPQRERLQPTPDPFDSGAAGGQSNGSAAPITPPAPVRPATPRREIDL